MPKTSEITLPEEFASTMQQLVAQANKTVPAFTSENETLDRVEPDQLAAIEEKLASLEKMMTAGFAQKAAPATTGDNVVEKLDRIELQLDALRQTDSVNQRLFNSLHDELKSYRDNFLRESLQKPFIRDLVTLFDDLSNLSSQMDHLPAAGPIGQWRENLRNSMHALLEILNRMEVNEIEPRDRVDLAVHRVISYEPADFAEDDGRIIMRMKRGFVWRDQLLRPEEVIARRFA